MYLEIQRQFTNQEIRIPIRTRGPQRIVVRAYNPRKANTVYFDTAPVIKNPEMVIIRIPKMPPAVYIEIYNERAGNIQFDSSFQIGKIVCKPINLPFMIRTFMAPTVKAFAEFSDYFAENAAIISAQNSVYRSNDGQFEIHYKDVIRDENGKELRTPARVNSKSKIMEIAKKYYINYTVPGRKAINWHEFSHVHKNVNPADELEADKNAITIYLGTGNPTIEAYNVFLKVFKNTPTEINRRRYNELNAYIKNFNSIMTKRLGVKTTVTQ